MCWVGEAVVNSPSSRLNPHICGLLLLWVLEERGFVFP